MLPLRGKILNSEGLALGKVLANTELADLVTAIGTGAGEKFDIDGLRYGKIILLMDADADGHHITTLLLTFFFRHMTELIRKGHVYIAQPPLYRIDVGKETHWARDDAHKEEILAGLRANAKPEITRFKGLGEMDAEGAGRNDARPAQAHAAARCRSTRTSKPTRRSSNCSARTRRAGYEFIMEKAAYADGLDELDCVDDPTIEPLPDCPAATASAVYTNAANPRSISRSSVMAHDAVRFVSFFLQHEAEQRNRIGGRPPTSTARAMAGSSNSNSPAWNPMTSN